MQRWRLITLAALFAAPILTLLGFGGYYLWLSGLAVWIWWPLSASIALACFLAWRWQKQRHLLSAEPPTALHWTERDRQAWKLVEARARQVDHFNPQELLAPVKYFETAQHMAMELARFYHPGVQDPVGSLTIPEMLTVIELATHDLAEMVDQYLPGGHLLTVNDLRRIKTLADWYPTVSNIYWLIAMAFNPVTTAAKFLATQGGLALPWQMLRENVIVWFFTAYIHRIGYYLIELNSGRLRVGALRYQQIQKANRPGNGAAGSAIPMVKFVLVGQAKVGKSSLINALLGEQKAMTDVVPATAEITRYELQPPGVSSRLQLLDTVGYGNNGPREDQLRATEDAARQADLILLVLHARNPARQADLDLLKRLDQFYKSHADMRKPPMLAVLTHIDLLSPALEWQPPYDWQNPQRLKEQQIGDAVAAVLDQFGDFVDGVIPVCTAPGKILGIEEWLLPAFAGLLDQAHAVAFLHCLKAEIDTGKIRRVFHQLLSACKGLGQILVRTVRKQ